ncbi:MAG: TlpA disulfide reductase family protein [Bacteroidota bacterium]
MKQAPKFTTALVDLGLGAVLFGICVLIMRTLGFGAAFTITGILSLIVGLWRGRRMVVNISTHIMSLNAFFFLFLVAGLSEHVNLWFLLASYGMSSLGLWLEVEASNAWKSRRQLLIGALIVLLPVLGFWALPTLQKARMTTEVKEPLPGFTVHTLDGQPLQSADLIGKVVIIDFWATWCRPCREEFAELKQFYQEIAHNDKVALIAINTGSGGDTPEAAQAFAEKYDLPFPVLFDTRAQAGNLLQVSSLPTLLVVDPQGYVRYRHEGFDQAEGLSAWLLNVIEELKQ